MFDVITKEEQERKKMTLEEAIKAQIREYLKREVDNNPVTMAVFFFFDTFSGNDSLKTLLTKIKEVAKDDFSTLDIINFYPVTPDYLFDELLAKYPFTMFPPETFGEKKEDWITDPLSYTMHLLDKHKYDENRMLMTREKIASLLGMTEGQLNEKTMFKGLESKYPKTKTINGIVSLPYTPPGEEEGETETGTTLNGILDLFIKYWFISIPACLLLLKLVFGKR